MTGAALMLGSLSAGAAKMVHTIGDSTMANYDESKTVTRGWCQYLQQFLDGIEVNNRAKSGSSSKSFYQESPYWATVKKQMQPGDYVVIQFSHNDEKNQGMDGNEVKDYYTSIGDEATAASTDYRGTNPSTTYKEYLRKYVNETREAGCTPILCAPVCRMYFTGNTIRRNGRHDLGDNFSKLTPDGIKTGQKVAADDHSMDYAYQMKLVAEEMDVPYIDLTTATADLYLSYGQTDCMALLSDGDGSTHLSATGAALIARRFAQLCNEAGLLSEYISLSSELSVSPASADFGSAYKGQTLTKEFMVSGFDLSPSKGEITITTSGGVLLSADKKNWSPTISLNYDGATLLQRFYASVTLENNGDYSATITLKAGDKTTELPVKATAVSLEGGQEVSAYWRLEKDDNCDTGNAPVEIIPETWEGMYVQRYANPNANTIWPEETGFDASRKTQRNLIVGDVWPKDEIDEVSTRYIEFGVKAMASSTLKIDEISLFLCGCGGNGMCVKVYYSTEENFANPVLIYEKKKLPANNMQFIQEKPVVSLDGGQAIRLRVYPWYDGTATGKTICLSDVKFHGFVMDAESSIDTVTASKDVVSTTYYDLQGRSVSHPSKGFYICKVTYSDGTMDAKKINL